MSVSFTPLKSLDPWLVNQLKDSLSDSLFERLGRSLSIDQDRLKFAGYKIRVLEERLRLVRIEKYGPGSEKLSDAQLELLELEPGVSSTEIAAESERGQLSLPLRTARKHPGRQQLPEELPRKEQIIACSAQQCVCGNCGRETVVIGYEQSEKLDVEAAKYFVRVIKREKRACKSCEEQGVQCAPTAGTYHRKGTGQRSSGNRHGSEQIRRSRAALSSERDPEARGRLGNLSGDFGWLGYAGR